MLRKSFTLGRWWVLIISAPALVAVIIGLIGLAGGFAPPPARDLLGHPVQLDADTTPRPEASAVPFGHGRFIAKDVALDVPLGALDVVDGSVVPPGFTSAYLIRDVGVLPAQADRGAVFVVMHSLRNGGVAPGNALIDIVRGEAKVRAGSAIQVDDIEYRVTKTRTVPKRQLPESDIWDSPAGTLVVITCLQNPDGSPSVRNVVIEAELSAPAA